MSQNNKLSHLDNEGLPGMVDTSNKSNTIREALASGKIILSQTIMSTLSDEGFTTKKGGIIQTAIIAGTMAVKKTADTIPLCHQIPITSCKLLIDAKEDHFLITCRVKTNAQTGIEMEALHGVSVAALTIYDMCKALAKDMIITDIKLEEKTGGKNDYKRKTS